jgi:hypothetical protein
VGGSNPRLERFKKALIAMQVHARENEHPPKHAVIKLEESELRPIEKNKKMHKDVAPLFLKMRPTWPTWPTRLERAQRPPTRLESPPPTARQMLT